MVQLARSMLQIQPAPLVVSPELDAAIKWVTRELENILNRLNEPNEVRLKVQNTVPSRPRAGMVVYADGVHWNPGSGEGIYYYKSTGVWTLLG